MSNEVHSMEVLLERLQVGGLLSDQKTAAIRQRLGQPKDVSGEAAWAARIIYGLGAWFSAAFFIAFLAAAKIIDSEARSLGCGIVLLALSVAISQKERNAFASQIALALAFAGNVLTLVGTVPSHHGAELSAALVVHAIVCVAVCPFHRSSIYRFLAPTVLSVLATLWIVDKGLLAVLDVLIGGEMLLFGLLFLHGWHGPRLVPLAYSAAFMLPATLLFVNISQMQIFRGHAWQSISNKPLWLSSLLLAAGLIHLFLHLSGNSKQVLRKPWMLLATAASVLLGLLTTPGILVVAGLLVMGRALGNRILTVLALIFLPCFLTTFYYALHVDLAHKSWIIAGSGVLLLVVRQLAGSSLMPKETAS